MHTPGRLERLILFVHQIEPQYALAACVQMITRTEHTQQDIYFKILRLHQAIRNQDCAGKAIHPNIVGYREKQCLLIELLLNYYSAEPYTISICPRFEVFPAIAFLNSGKTSSIVRGHPVLVQEIQKEAVTILDPCMNGPTKVLVNRLSGMTFLYYSVKKSADVSTRA